MFFDSHAHLTGDRVFEQLSQVLERASEGGVEGIINICTDKTTLERGLDLAQSHEWIYTAGATTPHDVEREGSLYFPLFEKAARAKKLQAIGETGLDYHYKHSLVQLQKAFLIQYMQLGIECDLPLIFHCRDAFDDLFALSDTEYKKEGKVQPAILHCFTGTMKEAEGVLKRGWKLSLSGIITFKSSKSVESLREIAREVPLDELLIETDAPYLAPQTRRGQVNEPSFIEETAQVIAQIKGLSVEELAQSTARNAKAFLRLL